MKSFAPIIYFAYNRPYHTLKTLEALSLCALADESTLYIYVDGAKKNATAEDKNNIEEVKKIAGRKQWCKNVFIHTSTENNGLFKSIIQGITNTINKHSKAIILEDDVMVFQGFLNYMNDALNFYENTPEVMHISGFSWPEFNAVSLNESTYFFAHTTCWGWATWKRAWDKFIPDPLLLKKLASKKGGIKKLNVNGTLEIFWGLKAIADGKFQSWNTLWHTVVFLNDGLCLHPIKSKVSNIGFDGSGTNCKPNAVNGQNHIFEEILPVKAIPLKENKIIKDFYYKSFSFKYKFIFSVKHYLRYLFWR